VEICVEGLEHQAAARTVAKAVATSLLVKTALFGKDANWGRLLAAAGRAGVAFDPAHASISVAGIKILEAGVPLGAAAEAEAGAGMGEKSYRIVLTLGTGPGSFTYLTSDLGHGYVDVNAGYRTSQRWRRPASCCLRRCCSLSLARRRHMGPSARSWGNRATGACSS